MRRMSPKQSLNNHKRVYRIMACNSLLLERSGYARPERNHDGKVIMTHSNLRWCSDGLEFACWNGEMIRLAFPIDAHDREIISWRAVANAGISGSVVRDMLLEAIERRFGTHRAPEQIEFLTGNGSAYTAKETRIFAQQLGLKSCFTPVKSQQSNDMSEAFVKTLKRDYVRVNPLPDAETVLRLIGNWIEDYNDNHPHSGVKWKSPREFIRTKTETARCPVKRGLDQPFKLAMMREIQTIPSLQSGLAIEMRDEAWVIGLADW